MALHPSQASTNWPTRRGLVGPMGEIAVVAGGDAEHAHEVGDAAQQQGRGVHACEEQRRGRPGAARRTARTSATGEPGPQHRHWSDVAGTGRAGEITLLMKSYLSSTTAVERAARPEKSVLLVLASPSSSTVTILRTSHAIGQATQAECLKTILLSRLTFCFSWYIPEGRGCPTRSGQR